MSDDFFVAIHSIFLLPPHTDLSSHPIPIISIPPSLPFPSHLLFPFAIRNFTHPKMSMKNTPRHLPIEGENESVVSILISRMQKAANNFLSWISMLFAWAVPLVCLCRAWRGRVGGGRNGWRRVEATAEGRREVLEREKKREGILYCSQDVRTVVKIWPKYWGLCSGV